MRHEHEFEEFVRRRRRALLTTATALTAGDAFLAEDLVQGTLVRVYLAWKRARSGNVDAYARRVLVNAFIDHRRRPFVRREHVVASPPDRAAAAGADLDDSHLLAALAELPPRMRAAVVLRHVDDLSVEDTAAALGCSTGTVKSQTARALAKLRDSLAMPPEPITTAAQGELP
ncbi:MAG TPA: SigE family RNA polymerase sigma factor [Marmoricola sp.]|nr:SigE family RNA polymerase sigma factor [Marmoricola sp.]